MNDFVGCAARTDSFRIISRKERKGREVGARFVAPSDITTKGTKHTKSKTGTPFFVLFVCFVVECLLIPNFASLRLGGRISESDPTFVSFVPLR